MSRTDRRSSEETGWTQDGDFEPTRDLTGATLGDFQVQKLLGRGGMGEVYLATQLSLARPVALKVLRANFAANPTYLTRLRTEATAVAKLNHPNIVHVYTFGCIDRINFIAMEYVQGTNLREYIIKKGALDIPLAFSIMRQTGQAIGAAGEVGLVHRDVKPENILVTKKGRVKVADFGLCRDEESDRAHVTQSGVTMGTPLYMSPEQAQGQAIDHRSDLYSLGVTFYHMLAGIPPFQAETALALALKQVREFPRSMLVHRPDLPGELDRLVLKLMAKDPADRYQSAAEMLADLAKTRDSLQIGATAIVSDATASAATRYDDSRSTDVGNAPTPKSGSSPRTTETAVSSAASLVLPMRDVLARLSPRLVIATSAACLFVGAIAGWNARNPDVLSVPWDATPPALWVEPQWSAIPNQGTAEKQLRYALLQAPDDELSAAFLAVAGYFPGSREYVSKAYTHVARIWYRRRDVSALATLEAELPQWKNKQKRDQDLVDSIHAAVKLKKGDFEGVVSGMKHVLRDDLPDIYDPALVELNLEICADALSAANHHADVESMKPTIQKFWVELLRRLYRIERPKNVRKK